jgi:hypothetical protein
MLKLEAFNWTACPTTALVKEALALVRTVFPPAVTPSVPWATTARLVPPLVSSPEVRPY